MAGLLNKILGSFTDKVPPKKGPSGSSILTEAKEAFARAVDAESKNRAAWLDDVRFARLGEQWPEAVRRQRELQGRPCLTINRLPAFLRQVTNNARQNKPAIVTHPVGDGADQATSKILDGLIRNIEVSSNADVAYDTALDHAVTGGFGYIRITTEYADDDAFDQDIKIERVANPLTVYGDPDSMSADSADWNTALVTDLYRKEDFEKRWPDATPSDFEGDGRDKSLQWFTDDMVRVAEYWKREEVPVKLLLLTNGAVMHEPEYAKAKDLLDQLGVTIAQERMSKTHRVMQYIITGAEVLETNEWAGRYIPIVPVYGDEVIVEGEKHYLSLVRFAQDPQRMFNYWRTASTELVALAPKAPFVGAKGAFASDGDKWGTANSVNHPYLEYDVVEGAEPPQRQPFAGTPPGAMQEAMSANEDMKSIMGLFDASLGARSNETSGIAIRQRKMQGDVSTFNFLDNQARALRHLGRIIVDLIPRVYNTARIIRVIHEDGTNKSVPINQPKQPPAAPMPMQQGPSPQPVPMQGGAIPPMAPQQPSGTPEGQSDQRQEAEGLAQVYDLTVGKYDVTCDMGPSYATKREESAEQIMAFIKAVPNSAALIGDLLARNLDWPGAEEISERLKLMLPPAIQGKNPAVQQLQGQMQQMDQHAKEAVQTLKGQLQQVQQQAQEAIKTIAGQLEQCKSQLAIAKTDKEVDMIKAKIDGFNAETNRLKVLGTTLTPDMVQQLAMQTVQQALASPDPDPVQMGPDGQPIPPPPTPEQIAQQQAQEQAAQQAAQQAQAADQRHQQMVEALGQLAGHQQQLAQHLQQQGQHLENLHAAVSAPRELVKDAQGRPVGSRIAQPQQQAMPQPAAMQ